MEVTVATDKCQGHARCYAVAPDVFELDDDGYNRITRKEIPAGLEDQARLGVDSCPEGAITLVE